MTRVALTLVLVFVTSIAQAQTVLNPTSVAFTASPEHDVVIRDFPVAGTNTFVLDHYDFQVITMTIGGAIVFTQGLGKPTPDAANMISVPLAATTLAAMTRNVTYSGQVRAVGPPALGSLVSAPAVADRPFVVPAGPAVVANVKVR